MKTCARILALLLSIVNITILLLALALLSTRLTLLNESYLARLPARHGLHELVPVAILDTFLEQGRIFTNNPQLIEDIVATAGRQQLENFALALIPPQWVETQWESNVYAIFEWLEGNSDLPQLQLDTQALRENVRSPAVRQALEGFFSNLPPCGVEDYFWFFFGDYPKCRPSDNLLDTFINEVVLPGLEAIFPRVDPLEGILAPSDINSDLRRELGNVRTGFRILTWAIWGIWLVCGVILILIQALVARSLEDVLAWSGFQAAAAGGISIIGLGIGFSLLAIGAERWFRSLLADVKPSPISLTLGGILLEAILRDLMGVWLLIAALLSFLGVTALVAAILLRRLR